jgi:hypothetical protein
MLSGIGPWITGGRSAHVSVDGESLDLNEVLLSIFRCAFDPEHPDYWGEPRKDRPTQRTVESALVAEAICRLGPEFVAKLTARQRANVNQWLASCTIVPERHNNHAWFTALNQSARLELSRTFPEFKGDEAWLIEDLKALDALYKENNDGWYSDRPDMPVYDYYNFWTFGNFPLFWSRMIGRRYPEWDEKFKARSKKFLEHTPHFFAADGSHPLFGRSLLYRWAMLSPLALGYEQGLWPHSPGLLRRIIRSHLAWHWNLGCYDETRGKLRETYTPGGTPNIRERYIDNGHPYWAMQGFTFLALKPDDPLFTSSEESLPVERDDYALRFDGPKMLLLGQRGSGQVRWVQAENTALREPYRDQYTKFVASSHFPYSIIADDKRVPWDQQLVLRDRQTGQCATRAVGPGVVSGELLDGTTGVRAIWQARLGDETDESRAMVFKITSTLRIEGDFELRTHEIDAPANVAERVEVLEGSSGLGVQSPEEIEGEHGRQWRCIRSSKSGHAVASWALAGHDTSRTAIDFDEKGGAGVNLVYPHVAVVTLTGALPAGRSTFASLNYASPKPLDAAALHQRASELIQLWTKESKR